MEVKDIIKEDRNKIVPSYEYRDYYREDGSYLYNSNREANWYKIGVHDCFDYFEQNRLKACDNQTPQEAWREAEFVVPFVKEHHRTPTFSDAIEVTRKETVKKLLNELKRILPKYVFLSFDGILTMDWDKLHREFIECANKTMEE